jgi:membrane-associated phospholipid phosphatase
MRRFAPAPLLIISTTTLIAFGILARAVARRDTVRSDSAVRNGLQAARASGGDSVAEVSGPLGKEWLHLPATVALGVALWRQGLGTRAAVPVLASGISELLNRIMERRLRLRPVPPGHPKKHKTSFPSGHAMETSAVALTSAYVLARENLVRPGPAFVAAVLLSVGSALGRLYLDRHWVSDTIGGSLLGVSTAAACGAAYEALPPPSGLGSRVLDDA